MTSQEKVLAEIAEENIRLRVSVQDLKADIAQRWKDFEEESRKVIEYFHVWEEAKEEIKSLRGLRDLNRKLATQLESVEEDRCRLQESVKHLNAKLEAYRI